ncbi:carbon-monoxide dehydrogenase catalytic subunit [Desulfolithobacter dissulfuricans]|uniref:Carbon monoxide dehydrogenase n=1 Tax=Desulfolithobacter dissulfuricans TaxID=2795293 RepID=A0A915TXY0_9BACT|nr:anaerobic carbon-monoxide dehydrogenase catalytic subunit [Desulfolithobacter dissulfuricans]BCO07803.1 carbon-monoxide dehydrogenase catalytic subunit [Desulfolithobacter dissulfuricans]
MAKELPPIEERSLWEDAHKMLAKAEKEGIETAWDRLLQQTPHCTFGESGICCRICTMGPCRISKKAPLGVCGADTDVIVARNFGRFLAGGAAGHSDHGRDCIEAFHAVAHGETEDYQIKDEAKLRRIAEELGIAVEGRELLDIARDLVEEFWASFGSQRSQVCFVSRLPEKQQETWRKLGITPRGVDREITEMMHRTHMGCDNDAANTMLHSARMCLADGWAGSMIATEISDILFGTPKPRKAQVNLGVLKKDHVNILVHGHNPIVSEKIMEAVNDPELIALAKEKGAAGINLAGLCCTGNELMMRQGIPMAGNHLMTELAIITGAVELIVVDYQCIMPSLVQVGNCFHTKMITTADKARFTGAEHVKFEMHNGMDQARRVVRMAIERFPLRDQDRVEIPCDPVDIVTGFSNEALLEALGGTLTPLIEAIKAGKIRGAVAIVGCNNPKYKHDHCNVNLARELIKKDILVLVTGCVTTAAGKAGLLVPEAIDMAGPGLKEICGALGIPPVVHMGSCVDNARILQLAALLANELGVTIADLPLAASSPEWYSEKAATIGTYAVASGIYTHLGHPPNITGSKVVTDLALSGLDDLVGACFGIEPDPFKAADLIDERIRQKREALGLSA